MAQDSNNTIRKYEAIRRAFEVWKAKNYKGVLMYRDEYIYKKLEEEFYLSPKTIENIIFMRTKY